MPYITDYRHRQRRSGVSPGTITGDVLLGIAMTEPAHRSDPANVQTTARRDGDHYVLNGAKTFISNGQIGDLFVVAKTDPQASPPHAGISLILVDADTPGFVRGKKLDKLGLRGQDTSELYFEDCRVPVANLLGKEGTGFKLLMQKLQQERLVIAITSMASCRRALEDTMAYVKERRAFGQPIAAFQNTQFTLAELATEVEIGQAFVDKPLAAHVRREYIVMEVSGASGGRPTSRSASWANVSTSRGYGFIWRPRSPSTTRTRRCSRSTPGRTTMKVIIALAGLGIVASPSCILQRCGAFRGGGAGGCAAEEQRAKEEKARSATPERQVPDAIRSQMRSPNSSRPWRTRASWGERARA
jgi:hypothetical protein